jgi:pimeloyl-ACP methyl ester carboxylesterase
MIDEMEVVDPCIVRLRDGRSMGYSEYGAADGYPIVNAHVGRACRLDVAAADAVAAETGIRLISPDRPGVGRSDPQPGRTILDWAGDVADLLDQIHVDGFAAMGWSMGGQYAATLGYALPHRVTRVAIIAGALPPTETGVFRRTTRHGSIADPDVFAGAVDRGPVVRDHAVRVRRRADAVRATGRA